MRYSKLLLGIAGASFLTVSACSGKSEEQEQTLAPPEYYVDLSMQEFMLKVMEHSSQQVWQKTGYITDDEGFRSLFPKNDEEWQQAEASSLVIAELTNVLLLPERRVQDEVWDSAIVQTRDAALKTAEAARSQDEDAFMIAASEIFEGCKSCHAVYDPN